jgi:hypothetical protein
MSRNTKPTERSANAIVSDWRWFTLDSRVNGAIRDSKTLVAGTYSVPSRPTDVAALQRQNGAIGLRPSGQLRVEWRLQMPAARLGCCG